MAEHELNKIVDDGGEVFNLRDSTKQPVSDRVTSWGSTPSDTKYPSEKLVKTSLDAKAPNAPSEVTIANGDKIIISDSSDSNKVKRASVAFDGSTTKKFLSKKGTFEEVKESDVAWGGDFHTDLSPIEMGMYPQNLIANPPPENIKYEQTTDGGETWTVVSLTDSQKKQFCNLTSGVNLPAGPTTTDDNVLPLQRGRVTIALLPFGATEYSDTWCYGQVKRILLYVNRSSSPEVAHCVVEVQTGPHFIANDGVWTTLGDYNVSGDGGWNSIPMGDILGGLSAQLSGRRVAIRFTYWVTKKPTSGSGGRIALYSLGILPGTVWKSKANYVAKQKLPVQVENDGTGIVQKSRSLVTARKLAVSLSNTSTDTSFDGSADVTNIKTTGTLGISNGGTGKTTLKAAEYNLTTGKSEISDTTSGDDRVVFELASPSESNGVTRGFRKLSTIWTWIKGQISSVLGLSESNGVKTFTGNAATATALSAGADRTKLDGIAAGAEVNVQSDWNQTTTTADDYIKNKPTIPSGTQLVYDCGTGSTSSTDFDNALAAFNAGKWVIINKYSRVYYCVGSYSGPGLRFKQLADEVSLLKVNTLTWTKGSAPTEGTQLEASLSGHTHSQYLTASDITGKMETNGSNATSAAGGNIIRAMGDWNTPNENNEALPAANITSGGTDQGRYTFAKIWNWIISHTQTRIFKTSSDVYWGVGADSNHTIDLDYDGRTSSPKMGLWVRWASGSGAKYMCECDASGNCTFNGTSERARYAYHDYYIGSGTAYWIKIGRVYSSASSGSAGGALTAIISSGFNTSTGDLSAQIIRVSIRSKGLSTNGVTIVGDNVTLGLKSAVDGGDARFAVHTVTARTTSVNGVYDIYVEQKGYQHVDVLQLHNDNVEMTYNSDTTKAISDTTNMTIFSPTLPYAGSAVSATSATSATELRIPYGSGSAYLQIGVSGTGNYLTLGTNMADGVSVSYASNASTAAVGNLLAVANAAGTGVTSYYMRAIEYTSGGTTYIALTKNDGTSNVRVKSAENADGCDGWKFKVGSLGTATDTIYFIAGS